MIAKVFLTFPQQLVQEPVLHDLIRRFPVRTNIRGASVTDQIALMALHIEGEDADVAASVEWLKGIGVVVDDLNE